MRLCAVREALFSGTALLFLTWTSPQSRARFCAPNVVVFGTGQCHAAIETEPIVRIPCGCSRYSLSDLLSPGQLGGYRLVACSEQILWGPGEDEEVGGLTCRRTFRAGINLEPD